MIRIVQALTQLQTLPAVKTPEERQVQALGFSGLGFLGV